MIREFSFGLGPLCLRVNTHFGGICQFGLNPLLGVRVRVEGRSRLAQLETVFVDQIESGMLVTVGIFVRKGPAFGFFEDRRFVFQTRALFLVLPMIALNCVSRHSLVRPEGPFLLVEHRDAQVVPRVVDGARIFGLQELARSSNLSDRVLPLGLEGVVFERKERPRLGLLADVLISRFQRFDRGLDLELDCRACFFGVLLISMSTFLPFFS